MKSRFRAWSPESENQCSLSVAGNIHASIMVCALSIREKTENCTPAKQRALRFVLPGGLLLPSFILIVSFVLFLKRGLNRVL